MRKNLIITGIAAVAILTLSFVFRPGSTSAHSIPGRADVFDEEVSADIATSGMNFTTTTSAEWKLNAILINFSTAVARTTTVSIVTVSNSYELLKFENDTVQNIVNNDTFVFGAADEINVLIPITVGGGIVTVKFLKERF